ncbi:MAG: dihydropteroate synthase, partial [Bacteroidales bacterium]|nr:dihydropteroate synthase [Bacteroidales bacterium]
MLKTDKPLVMGIINLSPLSFYGESTCLTEEEFVSRFEKMLKDGADIIDIGACSTKPGLKSIPAEQEWNLLKPALKRVLRDFPYAEISLDTFRSEIVERAFDFVGDFIINDISAGEDDPQMLGMAARLELPYIAMHKRGTPETMQQMCNYTNVTEEVRDYFLDFTSRAENIGIKEIIIDPGFGFAKSVEQNYQLLRNLKRLAFNSPLSGKKYPILAGISRKSMIYKFLETSPEESLHATSALNLQALINGADILRVHDVKEAKE